MGIPAGFTGNMKAFHGFVTAKNILDGSCHNVVYARNTIGRWRAFIKYKWSISFTNLKAFIEYLVFFPVLEYFLPNIGKVKLLVFLVPALHLPQLFALIYK
jgi:hypothetical protein